MARGNQHLKRRSPANARVATQPVAAAKQRAKRPAWEDQLFFGRLRTHAKWMFVLLAVVFALSFVIFGVGSGSTGISQVFQNFFNGTSATGASLSSLEKKTTKHPKDAAAWLAYANKLQQKNQPDNAADALTTYIKLKPKDENALLQLAGIYLQRAEDWDTLYSLSQQRSQIIAPTTTFAPKATTALGKAWASLTDPISTAVTSGASTTQSTEYSQVTTYLTDREDTYKKLIKLTPENASNQYSLAQAASDAQDFKTAVASYKAFVKLAPSDSQAPTARKAIKALTAEIKASAAATGTTKTG